MEEMGVDDEGTVSDEMMEPSSRAVARVIRSRYSSHDDGDGEGRYGRKGRAVKLLNDEIHLNDTDTRLEVSAS